MKWTVFALGFILALCGLIAILQGYEIVEMERGWTLVIAGATALSAGIVTIALGFVINRLEVLIAVSGKQRSLVAFDDRASIGRTEPAAAAFATPVASAPPPASPAFAGMGRFFAAPDEGGREQEAEPPQPQEAPQPREAPLSHEALHPQEADEPDLFIQELSSLAELAVRSAAPPSPPPQAAAEMPAPGAAWSSPAPPDPSKARRPSLFTLPPRVPAKSIPAAGPWPSKPAPAVAPVVEEFEPAQESLAQESPFQASPVEAGPASFSNPHDWLERALAGTETDEKVPPKHMEEEEAERAPEPAITPETNEPEMQEPEMQESDWPAVVGRYESNGACYVLFTDGSIEAETESGVYRFASMAELKKFIEGEA